MWLVNYKLFIIAIIEIIIGLISVYCGADLYAVLMLFLWLFMMSYAYVQLPNRVFLFTFGIAFFVFLMGRELLESLFGYEIEYIPDYVVLKTKFIIIISIITLLFSHVLLETTSYFKLFHVNYKFNYNISKIRNIAKRFYYFSILASITNILVLGFIVFKYGYFDSYTDVTLSNLFNNPVIYLFEKISQMTPVFLTTFLATMPEKKECTTVLKPYFLYLILSLLTGQRSIFVIGCLWLTVYYYYRNSKDDVIWINKNKVKYAIVLIPMLIFILALIGNLREGGAFDRLDLIEIFSDFLYKQGVSINVIKRSIEFSNRLNENRLYSLNFIPNSIFGFIFGFDRYIGNSIEHAELGYSLAHALSYIMLGQEYLLGRGTGSSYLAELYFDFGYYGIILGNLLYSVLFVYMSKMYNKGFMYRLSALLILRQLLWSPRGGFSDFLLVFMQPFTILAFLLIYLSYKISFNHKRKF